jgi:hypothetical protein
MGQSFYIKIIAIATIFEYVGYRLKSKDYRPLASGVKNVSGFLRKI